MRVMDGIRWSTWFQTFTNEVTTGAAYCGAEESRMPTAKVITCPCGVVLRSEAEEELIGLAQKHAAEAHGMELTRDQALAMARPE